MADAADTARAARDEAACRSFHTSCGIHRFTLQVETESDSKCA